MPAAKGRETRKHIAAFEEWYAADRDFRATSEKTGTPQNTLYDWAARFGWRRRADDRDQEVIRLNAQKAIKAKADRIARHAEAGALLVERGMTFLRTDNSIENATDAIRAIKEGVNIERAAEGLPTWMLKVLGASDADLIRREDELRRELEDSGISIDSLRIGTARIVDSVARDVNAGAGDRHDGGRD